jgi:hypothetical protein
LHRLIDRVVLRPEDLIGRHGAGAEIPEGDRGQPRAGTGAGKTVVSQRIDDDGISVR